ncbi:MAG: 3-hydroxybutyryl-CoA dehydrogenase [uncultured Rubrobacteraceae bacterium]|uniref:3-hydroxybutyryl-CoA dehydrogenase n=1 Tax=uncultured Rubrobacteraceae bacterium TaxID=349277 RepID=A0A6J4R009_9ACTN|nr:MAG: 3-hydroxybutyryl-CoA dehydrogenase [uncultured Rubrobacteraceae bacterium]
MSGAPAVGVLGVGTMGAGIVQLAAQTGHSVVACDQSVEALEKAQRYIREGLSRFADRGAFSAAEADEHYDRIQWTVNLEDMAGAEAVIEAIVEKVAPKKEAFAALDEILPPDALLLTNTSSISITDLASATNRPEQVCGTHFFTPPPVREAVEVPRGLLTSDETVERAKALITSFGKLPVVVNKDVPGFVANRFLMPMIIEAARLLEEGVASKEDIDLLVKKGLGFPIGPFELGDFIGLDVALDVTAYVHEELGEAYYTPPRILKALVRAGRLGQKTGAGFYEYPEETE